MIDIVGKEQLEEFIWENKDKVVVIYFGAEWCGPCKNLKNKLASEEVVKEFSELVVGHLDVDETENEELSNLYKVSSIPVQLFVTLKGTEIVELKRIIGYDWSNFEMTYNSLRSKDVLSSV
jgi:thiol-disulfide isomerase/thioredoxin